MKEFILTQPYGSLNEMLSSAEVGIYKEELEQGNIEKYAIVSRIGNRYDLEGNKIIEFANNPFYKKEETTCEDIPVSYCEITKEDVVEEANITIEQVLEDKSMKYSEIEALIDAEVEKVKVHYENEIAQLKAQHIEEIKKAKEEVIAEIIAKLHA